MFSIILQAGTQAAGGAAKPNPIAQFLPFILMFVILYFLIIRPQRKRQKAQQILIDNLKINDEVITNAGMIGKIVNIKKDKNTILIRVDDTTGTKIEFQRSAIAGIVNDEKPKAK
ncbi:MAG: preprotein translocase subunit YajC [Candidatus Cloacimonetes bacterium]|jgi:preprotein translocase subunit YajC|nr:preprotein translocase subunit YajC [Candidatus Cloacimonadota bacterium]